MRYAAAALICVLAGCSSAPPRQSETPAPATSSKGGYYKDDGPGEKVPPNLDSIADVVPRAEPLHRFANRPYQVFGKEYVPLAALQPFRERGVASWYGRRYHGQKTSIGETYDMYAMSAAHPTLPIPSYARVTNVGNGRSVVVRINDRGPFHSGRVIDLSYAAAYRLGYVQAGSAEVEVESVVPGETPRGETQQAQAPSAPSMQVYVQLGAFSSRDNAESLRERVARELASLKESAQVLLSGNLWRLQLGPYRSQEDARSAAQRIESLLDLKALLVVR
jgi:rare lipoprotein A